MQPYCLRWGKVLHKSSLVSEASNNAAGFMQQDGWQQSVCSPYLEGETRVIQDGDFGSVRTKARKQSVEGAVGSTKQRLEAAANH